MRNILSCLVIVMMSCSAMAEHHDAENADLHAAIKAFDHAYANNDVEDYFSFYADDATVYFGAAGRENVAAYYELWTGLMEAGGGVELNEMSDLNVQVMPSGDVAVATSFIDNRTRSPDGTTSTSRAFETDVWQKIDGKWQIVSLHYSSITPEEEEVMTEAKVTTSPSPVRMDPDKISGVDLSVEERFVPPEAILEGSHRPRGDVLFRGEELTMEVYEDDPATFAINEPFPIDEFVLVLSGKLILTDTGGQMQEFAAGDSLVVPKGFTGTWKMLGNYRELIAVRTVAYEDASSTENEEL